jgi:hypothetical protein
MRDDRGDAQCPRCGSTNLTYKNVFDYYKCNDCRITFITPVYSYGDERISGLDSAKDVASKIFGQAQPETKESEPEKPAAPVIKARQRSNPSWLTISLAALVVILILVIVWLLFDTEILNFLSEL